METSTACHDQLKELRAKLHEQLDTLPGLAHAFSANASRLLKRDHINYLHSLEFGVTEEVKRTEGLEDASIRGTIKAKLLTSLLAFWIGSAAGAVTGTKNPWGLGMLTAASCLNKEELYGKVVIAVGKVGIPGGVEVVNVSELARESKSTESEIIASFEKDGYSLLMLDEFKGLLGDIESGILDGSILLPISQEQLVSQSLLE